MLKSRSWSFCVLEPGEDGDGVERLRTGNRVWVVLAPEVEAGVEAKAKAKANGSGANSDGVDGVEGSSGLPRLPGRLWWHLRPLRLDHLQHDEYLFLQLLREPARLQGLGQHHRSVATRAAVTGAVETGEVEVRRDRGLRQLLRCCCPRWSRWHPWTTTRMANEASSQSPLPPPLSLPPPPP